MGSRVFGEPIQILNLNSSTQEYELDNTKLEEIFLNRNLENVELSVVSIAGASRKGKSFLLNFFLRFLTVLYEPGGETEINTKKSGIQIWSWSEIGAALSKVMRFLLSFLLYFWTVPSENNTDDQQNNLAWLGDTNARLSGFEWGRNGGVRCTTGIWIWSKIFTKTMPNGQRIGIVLMDTQGACGDQSDAIIFAMSTMLSSIQIFNVFNQIRDDDLRHLKMMTEYGRFALEKAKCEAEPFQHIMFLVRDWNSPKDYRYGWSGGDRILKEKVFKISADSTSSVITVVRRYLLASYDDTSCFLMPHPGGDQDGRLCNINSEFMENLNDLISYLLEPTNITRRGLKQLGGATVKPREFYNLIQQYWTVFKSGKIPDPINWQKTLYEGMSEQNSLTKGPANNVLANEPVKTINIDKTDSPDDECSNHEILTKLSEVTDSLEKIKPSTENKSPEENVTKTESIEKPKPSSENKPPESYEKFKQGMTSAFFTGLTRVGQSTLEYVFDNIESIL